MLEIRLRFFLIVFLTFVSLIIYLVWFKNNNNRYFLPYMLARVSNFTIYDGTIINTISNEDRKNERMKEKMLKFAEIFKAFDSDALATFQYITCTFGK